MTDVTSLPDQHALWNAKHGKGEHAAHRASEMPFARRAVSYFSKGANILEIGCGVGADAIFFGEQGFDVLATDISEVVIAQDEQLYNSERVRFRQLDVAATLSFEDETFSAVYSHLALHYYSDETTRKIFDELRRVLKKGGTLAFACKSTHDSRYGIGNEVEPDLFVGKGGHVRHFFSVEYVQSLLGDDYNVVVLEEGEESYSDGISGFVYCIATKR
jgi:SAM-dependent methyltransferase